MVRSVTKFGVSSVKNLAMLTALIPTNLHQLFIASKFQRIMVLFSQLEFLSLLLFYSIKKKLYFPFKRVGQVSSEFGVFFADACFFQEVAFDFGDP